MLEVSHPGVMSAALGQLSRRIPPPRNNHKTHTLKSEPANASAFNNVDL